MPGTSTSLRSIARTAKPGQIILRVLDRTRHAIRNLWRGRSIRQANPRHEQALDPASGPHRFAIMLDPSRRNLAAVVFCEDKLSGAVRGVAPQHRIAHP